MPSSEDSSRWSINPFLYLWIFMNSFALLIIFIAFEHCRLKFEIFEEFCIRIENAITWFHGFIRTYCNCNVPEIVSTESSSGSMVTIDLEDTDWKNSYEFDVASLGRPGIFSPQPRTSPERDNSFHYPNDEEPMESIRDAPKENETSSRFSKYLTDFLGVKTPNFPKENTSRESNSGYEADTGSGLQDDMEMEVISDKRDQVKVQEGKIIIYFLDGNLIGNNKNHDGEKFDTDGPLEGKVDSRITCASQNDNLPSESHRDSLERYEQNNHNAECLDHQLALSTANDKFDSRQKSLNDQENPDKEDNQSWFKQYYDRILRRGATFSGPLGSSGGVKYSYTRKINEEDAMKIERESIHSNDEMEEDTNLRSNTKWEYRHKDLVPIHESCCIRHIDSESSDQEDDSDRKLRDNTIAEEHEEASPIASKIVATTSSAVNPGMQIDEIHPNKVFNVKSMDKKIKPSNAEESISCEERRDNEEENIAMLSETRKLKLWKSLDHDVIPGSKLTLECPSVSLDEQSLSKQANLPEMSAGVDIYEGNAIADSKKILEKSGLGIEKRRFSCDDSIRRNSSDFTSNHKRRGFMRSVSFAGTVSIVPNMKTKDNANETDQKGIECIVEQSDASNLKQEISLNDPIPNPESNSGSKFDGYLRWGKIDEEEENSDQKLDVCLNAKFLLRRSLILDPWPKSVRETGRLLRRSSKIKILKEMEEKCVPEEEKEEEGEGDDEGELGNKIHTISPVLLRKSSKPRDLRKQLLVKNLKRAIAKHEIGLPACTEEDDVEFSEPGNSYVEDVGEKDSVMEETIDD